MERLYFTCPTTGETVDVGIEAELDTLLRIRMKRVRMRCPACGQHHEWQVRDAQLAKAA
jgi:transcription elongation factor Elf1